MDWNGDGFPDIVFGHRRGGISLLTGNGDGTVHYVGHLYDDAGDEIRTVFNASPWLVDWDGDGALDLLLAGYLVDTVHGGILRVYPGIGDQSDTLLFDADYLDLTWFYNQRRTTAQTSDLDGDGDLDLVLGYETGEVYFAENTGTRREPRFRAYSVLHCDAGLIDVFSRFSGSGRARPTVCDYNADGIPDLLVGCQNGWVYFFAGYRDEATPDGPSGTALSLVVPGRLTAGDLALDLALPADGAADLTVLDIRGDTLATLAGLRAGPGSVDLSGAPSGVVVVVAEYDGRRVALPVLKL